MTELSGSYSGVEGSKMVFARGNKRLVLWMENDYGYKTYYGRITAYVAHITLGAGESMDRNYNWPSDWKKHADEAVAFYEVDRDWYVEDEEEAKAAQQKRHERHANKSHGWGWDKVEVTDGIYRVARKLKGFKTIKRCNLIVRRRTDRAEWRFENAVSGNAVTVR